MDQILSYIDEEPYFKDTNQLQSELIINNQSS